MNALKNVILIVLILIFGVTDLAKAGDSYSLSISCIIPEIPGVNTPLIQEKELKTNYEVTPVRPDTQDLQESDSTAEPKTIQTEEEIQLAKNKKEGTVVLQTIYSR